MNKQPSIPTTLSPAPGDISQESPIRFIAKREKARPRPVPNGYESVDGTVLTEPRIEAIRRELQALLSVVQLEVDGEPVEIDGFHLKNLKDWANSPTSLSDIFWHLSSVCNFNCEFCYEKGNPEDFPIQNATRMATLSEIDTRLKYYDVTTQRGLFSVRTAINEPFVNKNAVEVLRRIRAKNPDELISFVTNGSLLEGEAIDTIAELGPVFFNLSLYSTDSDVRGSVLGDRRPNNSVSAVEGLTEKQIPFMANLVMWPSIPFEDMEKTIACLDENRAALIRVCLGGYSRYLRGSFDRFKVEDYWPSVVDAVESLRDSYDTPILIEPNSFVKHDDAPVLDGVINDSPAALAGLRRGDEIVAVNEKPIATRMQLISTIRLLSGSKGERFRPPGVSADTGPIMPEEASVVTLKVQSQNGTRSVSLNRYEPEAMASYPYSSIATFNDFLFGLVLTDGLQYSALKKARDIITQHSAEQTLVLSSVMMLPIVEFMANKSGVFRGMDVSIRAAENEYFGGTINIGDLLVVTDFVDAIKKFSDEKSKKPDLVLVPSSPFASSLWERDLRGTPSTDIERLTGITTRLVPCQAIAF